MKKLWLSLPYKNLNSKWNFTCIKAFMWIASILDSLEKHIPERILPMDVFHRYKEIVDSWSENRKEENLAEPWEQDDPLALTHVLPERLPYQQPHTWP